MNFSLTTLIGGAGYSQTFARRAGSLLIVMGSLTVFLAAFTLLASLLNDSVLNTPELQSKLKQLELTPDKFRLMMKISSIAFALYATVAITLGLLVRGEKLGWLISGLVFCLVALFVIALQALASLLMGETSNLLITVLATAGHGVVVYWLLRALHARQTATPSASQARPGIPAPLAGYYVTPPFDIRGINRDLHFPMLSEREK